MSLIFVKLDSTTLTTTFLDADLMFEQVVAYAQCGNTLYVYHKSLGE